MAIQRYKPEQLVTFLWQTHLHLRVDSRFSPA